MVDGTKIGSVRSTLWGKAGLTHGTTSPRMMVIFFIDFESKWYSM
jgi:hypothetical protein